MRLCYCRSIQITYSITCKVLKPFKYSLTWIQASWRSIPDRFKLWAAVRAFPAKARILGHIMLELPRLQDCTLHAGSDLMAKVHT